MATRKRQLILILVALGCVLCLDQITKYFVLRELEAYSVSRRDHLDDFFWITHERNPGLVGGMFRDVPVIAYSAPVIATFILFYLYRHIEPHSRLQSVAYGMVAGGAVGNLVDRCRFGEVIDFLQFHFYFIPFNFPWKYYPAFNFADSAICTGVFLLIVSWYVVKQPRANSQTNVSDAV